MRPLVMGILNVTPDSFSDGGRFESRGAAIEHARQMIADGADIVDVGGESTRPGADPVDPREEMARVLPVIEALSVDCRISIDTRNPTTAAAAVAAGASIVNDVSSSLGSVAAELGVGFVAMHMSGDPRTMQDDPRYGDVVSEVADFLLEVAEDARDRGCPEVWLDPGFGFGKTEEHNRELLVRLDELVGLGFPVMVGLSRKRWLGWMHERSDGRVDRHGPVGTDDRLEAGVATATWAMSLGARMVRVHDVKSAVQAAAVVAGTLDLGADSDARSRTDPTDVGPTPIRRDA